MKLFNVIFCTLIVITGFVSARVPPYVERDVRFEIVRHFNEERKKIDVSIPNLTWNEDLETEAGRQLTDLHCLVQKSNNLKGVIPEENVNLETMIRALFNEKGCEETFCPDYTKVMNPHFNEISCAYQYCASENHADQMLVKYACLLTSSYSNLRIKRKTADGASTNSDTTAGGTSTNSDTTSSGTSTNSDTTAGGTSTNGDTTAGGTSTNSVTTAGGTSTNSDTTAGGTSTNSDITSKNPTSTPKKSFALKEKFSIGLLIINVILTFQFRGLQ